jgi:hypothetical protein
VSARLLSIDTHVFTHEPGGWLALSKRELLALVLLFALTLPAVTPRIYASDEIQYFSYLRSLWFDRDVSFENEYQYFFERDIGRGEGFHATFLELYTEAGRRPSFATIGSALLWSPFYLIGDIAARVSGAAVDGYSRPYIAAVAYGSAFYGFAAIVLSINIARRLVGRGVLAGLLVWFGTPLLFYMYVSPPYSHACSAFAVALFVTVWLRVRASWSVPGAIALGLSGALMAMVREQDAILVVGPALDFTLSVIRGDSVSFTQSSRGPTPARGSLAHSRSAAAAGAAETPTGNNHRQSGPLQPAKVLLVAATGSISFSIAMLPQLLAYKALNGHYGPSSLVIRKMSWTSPHALGVIASPEHGFFIWTPIAAIAILGLVMLAVRGSAQARRVALCALAMVAVQIYVSGSVESWTVAGAFGQRRFVALTVVLTLGLAALLHLVHARVPRALTLVVVALCLWWNVALIAAFGTGLMDRKRLEPGKNAYVAFVTLPKMIPDLAYRYVFDRASFYRQRPQ